MNAILSRRSIRKYTNRSVDDATIKGLLTAAMAAPSAGNQQPWQFVVMNERIVLDQVSSFHPHSAMILQAQCSILVCGDLEKEIHKGYWVQDCAAATENILIAVQEKGLGAVWMGIYPREERVDGLRKLLDIPAQVIPFSLIPVGYPAETKEPSNRFDPVRIHYNKW